MINVILAHRGLINPRTPKYRDFTEILFFLCTVMIIKLRHLYNNNRQTCGVPGSILIYLWPKTGILKRKKLIASN